MTRNRVYRRTRRKAQPRDLVFHKSVLSQTGKGAVAIFSTILLSAIGYSFPATILKISIADFAFGEVGLLVPVFGIVPIAVLLAAFCSIFNSRFVVGAESVRCVIGLLTPGLRTLEIYYNNVRMIEVEQTGLQRMFDLGNLRIGSLISEEGDVVLAGIRHPYQYKNLVERRMREFQ